MPSEKYEISRQATRSAERRLKKEARYNVTVLDAQLSFASDEYLQRAANAIRTEQQRIALGFGYPTKEDAAFAAEEFGHRAVRAYKKALARHFGTYSKYDTQGTIRTPSHLR